MSYWNFFSPANLAAIAIFLFFPVFFFSFIYLVEGSDSIVIEWELCSFNGLLFSFPVVLDMFSLLFALVVSLISFSVMLFTISYMSGDTNLEYFIYIVVLFVLSMNFLIFVPHLLMLLLGWDGLGLTSYILVIYYQSDYSLSAGMVTVISNRVGDSLLILAGSWAYLSGNWLISFSSFGLFWFMVLSVLIGSITNSAQLPFSAWLPAAIAAPTPVSSLVHSSTLVTAGVYLLVRFYWSLSCFDFFCFFIFYSGVFTCLMASLSAIYENDLNNVIALSTLSQLGVMIMSLGLGCPLLAFFHLITHALFNALLFICAGTIIHSKQNSQDVRLMGNLWNSIPVTCTAFNSANLALCGFPFMAGFYSNDLIVESFFVQFMPLTTSFFLILSVCLTSAYSIRLSMFTLWNPFKSPAVLMTNDESLVTYFSYFTLLSGAVFGGALVNYLIFPIPFSFVLPLSLNVLALFFITLFGVFTYFLVRSGGIFPFSRFIGSMWFLSFITTGPILRVLFYLGNKFYLQELTWLEVLSGKGVFGLFSFSSNLVQLSQNISFSYLFSLFTSLAVLLILCF